MLLGFRATMVVAVSMEERPARLATSSGHKGGKPLMRTEARHRTDVTAALVESSGARHQEDQSPLPELRSLWRPEDQEEEVTLTTTTDVPDTVELLPIADSGNEQAPETGMEGYAFPVNSPTEQPKAYHQGEPYGPHWPSFAGGRVGPPGPPGPPGVNSELRHPCIIPGEPGPPGVRGTKGLDGPTGPIGLRGDRGPTGVQGDEGATGAKGTKVNKTSATTSTRRRKKNKSDVPMNK